MSGMNQSIEKPQELAPGFSARASSPALEDYRKKLGQSSGRFTLVLAFLFVAGFPIYGAVTGELEILQSVYYGLGVGGLLLLINLVQTFRAGRDTTWNGVVMDKKSHRRRRVDHQDDPGTEYTEYVLSVKRENGKTHKLSFRSSEGIYDYFKVGDKVRHHRGFDFYERYDKSNDTHIPCIACSTMNPISNDVCSRCRCPLLT